MTICVSAKASGAFKDKIEKQFENAKVFTIIESETDQIVEIYKVKKKFKDLFDFAELLSEKGVDSIICTEMDTNIILPFSRYTITVFTEAHGTVENAYNMWKKGELPANHVSED